MADGYKYAKSHEWAKVDGDVATVGISDHAQVRSGMCLRSFSPSYSTHTRL